MRKRITWTVAAAALALFGTRVATAATAMASGTITANVNAAANLTLSANNLTFPSANPTVTPNVAPSEGTVTVTVKSRSARNGFVTLTVKAADDLKSGSDVIGIDNVSWTTSSPGFTGGTMSKSGEQPVGFWVGPGTRIGTVNFLFANSYNYVTGVYTASITYTLTSP